ncbi:hypothetical protein [Flammeovirga pectinis]|nr:hypothetical protein [Flammeovirga pectinis]
MWKYFQLMVSFLYLPLGLMAQDRAFTEDNVKLLQEDPDFIYRLPQNQISIWDHIGMWLSDFMSIFFDNDIYFEGDFLRDIFWVLIVLIVLWAIYLFLKSNKLLIFSSADKIIKSDLTKIYAENENLIPLSSQLKEAISKNDYHEIVRLYYLLAIDKLDQKKIINLRKVDHHNDILLQLKDDLLKTPFHSIGVYFQYCWYGEFEANETICHQLESMYQNFETAVEQHENL